MARNRENALREREAADAAYRKALGVEDGQPLPNSAGAVSSGASRGGRGRSHSKAAKDRRRKSGHK
ncbi:hypothetical protein ABQF49_16730 [Mycolicibacterium porcinum]